MGSILCFDHGERIYSKSSGGPNPVERTKQYSGTVKSTDFKDVYYPNQIDVITNFWRDNVAPLKEEIDDTKYMKLCESLFTNIFKLAPFAKALFEHTNMQQGQIFFNKFTWIVETLSKPNYTNVLQELKDLGELHKSLGVQLEHYPVVLKAFHDTMEATFKKKYTKRVRYCYDNLYKVIVNTMNFSEQETGLYLLELHMGSVSWIDHSHLDINIRNVNASKSKSLDHNSMDCDM